MRTQTAPIEIFVADDHELLRQGLRSLIDKEEDMKVIGEAVNGADLINQIQHNPPDVILVDIQMPVMDGIEATKIITKNYPGIVVIAITVHDHEYNIIQMIVAGAKGFLSKGVNPKEMKDAIRTVHNNGMYYDEPVSIKISGMIANKLFDPHQKVFTVNLTSRETAVLRLVCMQRSNKDISLILSLSPRTIEDFRTRLLAKTRSYNTAGLVVFAMRYGIYSPEQNDQYLASIRNS